MNLALMRVMAEARDTILIGIYRILLISVLMLSVAHADQKENFLTSQGKKFVRNSILCAAVISAIGYADYKEIHDANKNQGLKKVAPTHPIQVPEKEKSFGEIYNIRLLDLGSNSDHTFGISSKGLSDKNTNFVATEIKSALSLYPPHFLESTVRSIYAGDNVINDHIEIGGIALPEQKIAIRADQITRISFQRVFHHEVAHGLFNQFRLSFDQERWLALNPRNFKYHSSGFMFIKSGEVNKPNKWVVEGGAFLDGYCTASIDEDFAKISENLFLNRSEFWKQVSGSRSLQGKVALAIKFYNQLSPVFTETYFRSISHEEGLASNP
ncbi:MAG: uncharacterized protein JWQ35_2065 [Bacteriovoracaceae bacterium]|nr:uncharacterized protein [Bacteriovoracaceae bacterium]